MHWKNSLKKFIKKFIKKFFICSRATQFFSLLLYEFYESKRQWTMWIKYRRNMRWIMYDLINCIRKLASTKNKKKTNTNKWKMIANSHTNASKNKWMCRNVYFYSWIDRQFFCFARGKKRTHTHAYAHATIDCTACSQPTNDSETYALNDKIARRHTHR